MSNEQIEKRFILNKSGDTLCIAKPKIVLQRGKASSESYPLLELEASDEVQKLKQGGWIQLLTIEEKAKFLQGTAPVIAQKVQQLAEEKKKYFAELKGPIGAKEMEKALDTIEQKYDLGEVEDKDVLEKVKEAEEKVKKSLDDIVKEVEDKKPTPSIVIEEKNPIADLPEGVADFLTKSFEFKKLIIRTMNDKKLLEQIIQYDAAQNVKELCAKRLQELGKV